MKTSELLEILRDNDCFLEKHGGRHDKWRSRKTGEFEWVPGTLQKSTKDLRRKS